MSGPDLILPTPIIPPRWIAGRYYDARSILGGNNATGAISADVLYASPLYVPPGSRIDRIGVTVGSAAASGKLMRFMIHAMGNDTLPGALLLDGGTVLVDGTGDKTVTVDYAPPTPFVYVTAFSDGTPTISALTPNFVDIFGDATPTVANSSGSPFRSLAFGAAPATFGSVAGYTSGTIWRFAVRAV